MKSLDFDAFDFFKSEMLSEELHVKINAIHRLSIISTIIGPERVETDLLPYLSSLISSEQDEVLFALAKEIGNLHIYLTDTPSKLLPLLEDLSGAEESVVRDQAVSSLINLASYLPDYQLVHSFVGSILKLSSSEKFTAKISSCKLFLAAYPRAGGFREKLRNKLAELCQDENFMIRKSAAEEIGKLIIVIDKPIIINDILPIIKILMVDEQEEIRILCIKFFTFLCENFTKEENKGILIPNLAVFENDKSWKVRQFFALNFAEIVLKIEKEIFENNLMQIIITLINDSETEVKIGILASLSKIIQVISISKLQSQIFPTISSLYQDNSTSNKIKYSCVDSFIEIWKVSEEGFCINSIFPLIESFFFASPLDLKLKIAKNLHFFSNIGEDFVFNKLKPILDDSCKDFKSWRLRKLGLKSVTKIILNCGISLFASGLYLFYLNFIRDPVSELRESVVKELKKLKEMIEPEWVASVFYPKLLEMYQESQWYLHRVCIVHLLGSIPGDYLNIISSASKDPVPNIRLAVCKTIQTMSQEGKEITVYAR